MKKRIFMVSLLVLFLVISAMFISPAARRAKSLYSSVSLKEVTVQEGDKKRTDYVNEKGIITVAADVGYATKIVTADNNHVLEEYYDDQGKPTNRIYSGYYALKKEYLDSGKKVIVTYLDKTGEPFIIPEGYAIEERLYNERGQLEVVYYLGRNAEAVETYFFGFEKRNEYDEHGNVCRITYLNISGEPIKTGQGYASVVRSYYSGESPYSGRVKDEFYFDENGDPVSLSLGEYGVHREYNEIGWNSVITYLDADGNPAANNQGYTTVVRTFHADNSIETERYFDADGKPYALGAGQYGIRKEAGKTVYLDENGNERFDLKNLLYNHSRLVIPAAIILVVMASLVGPKGNRVLLVLYLAVIAYVTLMFRENDEGRIQLIPFWSYRQILFNSGLRADIFRNIWLFVPLGAILYRLYPKWTVLLVPFALSAAIEAVQYFAGIGFCELDDMVSNVLGGLIGYGSERLLKDAVHKIPGRRRLNNAKNE